MATVNVGKSAGAQLKSGVAILAAARTVDTRLIKDRLAAFDHAQQSYTGAEAKVQHAEAELEKAAAHFRSEQQDVVDALARALVADGQPLKNPFAAFGAAAPGTLMRMPPAEAAKALPQLIATMRHSKTQGKATLQALTAAEKTMRALDQALIRIEAMRTATHHARAARDAVAQTWNAALGALKRGARAAADDGAPTLYGTIFDRPTHATSKNAKPAPAPQPAPVPAPTTSPAPSPDPAAS